MKTGRINWNSTLGMTGAFMTAFAAGFLLSGTSMAGIASFADISIAGALNLPASSAVLTGSLVHSIINHSIGQDIIRISSMILIVAMKMFLEARTSPKVCGICTALGVIMAGAAVSALIGEIAYKLFFYVFYGALAGFAAYSASLIISGLSMQLVIDFSSQGCAYAVVYTIFTASLCSVKIPFLNLGIIFGMTVTLLAAYYYRHTGGVLCGALTACGAFLSSVSCGMTVVLLPAAGLLTGYLYRLKSRTAAAAFTGINFFLIVLTGLTENSIYSMINTACSAVLFMLAAPSYSDKWVSVGSRGGVSLPRIISLRMKFLSDSIATVRKESERLSELLSKENDTIQAADEHSRRICRRCMRREKCWEQSAERTAKGLKKLAESAELSKENFPYELKDCLHKNRQIEAVRRNSRERIENRLISARPSDGQRILYEQMKIMEEIVYAAGERTDVRCSEPVSKIVMNKLGKFGIYPDGAIAYYNSVNRLHVELYFSAADAPENCMRICDLIADELHIRLSCTAPAYSGKQVRFRFFELPEYTLEVYTASACAENTSETGDSSTVFTDGTGISYVVLSDGMGTGKNAAIESKIVVKMFRKLISSGVNYSSAVKLINSIMVTKSNDEAFATLDAVRVDLDTCGLTVIKSGASATLIRHRGSVLKITSPTFPIGIYEQSETYAGQCDFEEGDIIIMFSDGIGENEYKYIKELLLGSSDLKKIVSEICTKAPVFNAAAHADDVTVIGIQIVRSER